MTLTERARELADVVVSKDIHEPVRTAIVEKWMPIFLHHLQTVRNEALEEAANTADFVTICSMGGSPQEEMHETGIGKSIRALKSPPKGNV